MVRSSATRQLFCEHCLGCVCGKEFDDCCTRRRRKGSRFQYTSATCPKDSRWFEAGGRCGRSRECRACRDA